MCMYIYKGKGKRRIKKEERNKKMAKFLHLVVKKYSSCMEKPYTFERSNED